LSPILKTSSLVPNSPRSLDDLQWLTLDIEHRCLIGEGGHVRWAPDTPIRVLVSFRTSVPQTSTSEREIGPLQQRERSDVDGLNSYSGPRKVGPRIILSYQLKNKIWGKPKSRGIHACGVYSAYRRDTREQSLEALRPIRVRVFREVACMACEYLGHLQNRWCQRLGAQVGTQATTLLVVALQLREVPCARLRWYYVIAAQGHSPRNPRHG